MNQNNLIMGIWKFSDKIPQKDLIEIANEWAKDEKYTQLYIRKVSKNQNGIGFSYAIDKDSKEAMDEYLYIVSDFLRKKFGNDLAGWDIANTAVVIK